MSIIPFDTLDYSRTLQEAGIAQAHAEAFARAQKSAKFSTTKHEILKWMFSLVIGMSGFLAGVMYFFLKNLQHLP